MNSKKSKMLRRNAKILSLGKPPIEVQKTIKRFKAVYKDIKQGK
jgi:hypothetical protein